MPKPHRSFTFTFKVRASAVAVLIAIFLLAAGKTLGGELKYSSPSSSVSGSSSGDDPNCHTNQFECTPTDAAKVAGCSVLDTSHLPDSYAGQIGDCLNSVNQTLNGPLFANKMAVQKISSKRVQSFLGYVLTCYGEAASDAKPADMMAIMLTIANRTNQCNRELAPRSFTPMNIALQKDQFSMYNPAEYAKTKGKGAFEARASDPKMKKCIEAFLKFSKTQPTDFQPQPQAKQVMYYYAPAGMTNAAKKPEWDDPSKQVNLVINNENISPGVHKFQYNSWACQPFADDGGIGATK